MHKEFTEAKLETEFGQFNFRVYNQLHGRETIVLYTECLDITTPPLVRIHSECITGDMFNSKHCDCGNQLNISLKLIKEKNGILIYLRQEGRGIGLYEKIKAYQLQAKGYDTFNANTALGHKPDERTYEMAKVALEDLGVSTITLITNNPSKVSEISKLGIKVIERMPLIVSSNPKNQNYLLTKKNKFKHLFTNEPHIYYYQFQGDLNLDLIKIKEFLQDKINDPFLRIAIGIPANSNTLKDPLELNKIKELFAKVSAENFIPILHFSFQGTSNPLTEIRNIKTFIPFAKNIQLNDIDNMEPGFLTKCCQEFKVFLPLSKNNFHLIHHEIIREIIHKFKINLIIDNSKGKGIQESFISFQEKIDTLLAYGLNEIGVCGGFGPDNLHTYFELQRYYKINFSIDAETKLKTNQRMDIDKIKTYLFQLLRADRPKASGVVQTRKFLADNRKDDWDIITINDKKFHIHPKVFNPGAFPSTKWFAKILKQHIKNEEYFCEIGCGAGVISCLVAIHNKNMKVIATDINPFAVENSKFNLIQHNLEKQIEVFEGNVLDNIPPTYKFDTIFWALPFGFLDPGSPISLEDMQVFDPGYKSIRTLFKTARHFLKPNGQLLLGFSKDLGHEDLLNQLAAMENIQINEIASTMLQETNKVRFEILRGVYR